MVHATTQTVNGKSSATVTSIDNLPDAILFTTFGDSEVGRAESLPQARRGGLRSADADRHPCAARRQNFGESDLTMTKSIPYAV